MMHTLKQYLYSTAMDKNTAALLLSFVASVLVLLPFEVYLINLVDFTTSIPEMLAGLVLLAMLVAFAILLASLCLSQKAGNLFFAFILSLYLVCLLEAKFFMWNFVEFSGNDLNATIKDWHIWVDSVIISLAVLTVFKFRNALHLSAKKVSIGLLFFTVFTTAPTTSELFFKDSGYTRASVDYDKFYELSEEENIFVIVLDAFGAEQFQYWQDRGHPSIASFDGFTFFRNNISHYGFTEYSLPTILNGQIYDKATPLDVFQTETTQTTISKRLASYDSHHLMLADRFCNFFPLDECGARLGLILRGETFGMDFLALLDYSAYRYFPISMKGSINNDNQWFFQRLAGQMNSIAEEARFKDKVRPLFLDEAVVSLLESRLHVGARRPQFRFLHLNMPHNPARYDENCQMIEFEANDWKSLTDQAGCALRFTETILKKLKDLGIYDKSMLFVISDHSGTARQQIPEIFGATTPTFPPTRSTALLLAKDFGARGDVIIDDSPTVISDVYHTVTQGAGEGAVNLFDPSRPKQRERVFWYFEQYARRDRESIWHALTVNGHAWRAENWNVSSQLMLADDNAEKQLPFKALISNENADFVEYLSLFGFSNLDEPKNNCLLDTASVYFQVDERTSSFSLTFERVVDANPMLDWEFQLNEVDVKFNLDAKNAGRVVLNFENAEFASDRINVLTMLPDPRSMCASENPVTFSSLRLL